MFTIHKLLYFNLTCNSWTGCSFRGGICIWAASFPGNAASVRPGAVSFLGSFSRGSGVRYTLVDFLRSHDEQISALSWSPDGRYPNQLKFFSPFIILADDILLMLYFYYSFSIVSLPKYFNLILEISLTHWHISSICLL